MDSGELCVMTRLVKVMPILFADSWDTTVRLAMIISQCEFSSLVCTLCMCTRFWVKLLEWENVPKLSLDIKLSCSKTGSHVHE